MKIVEIIFPSVLVLLWNGTFQEIQGTPEDEIWELQNENGFGDFNYGNRTTQAWGSLCRIGYRLAFRKRIRHRVRVNKPELVERTFVFKKTKRGDSQYVNIFPFLKCHLLDTLDPFWLLSKEPNTFFVCVEEDAENPLDKDLDALIVKYRYELIDPVLHN